MLHKVTPSKWSAGFRHLPSSALRITPGIATTSNVKCLILSRMTGTTQFQPTSDFDYELERLPTEMSLEERDSERDTLVTRDDDREPLTMAKGTSHGARH